MLLLSHLNICYHIQFIDWTYSKTIIFSIIGGEGVYQTAKTFAKQTRKWSDLPLSYSKNPVFPLIKHHMCVCLYVHVHVHT